MPVTRSQAKTQDGSQTNPPRQTSKRPAKPKEKIQEPVFETPTSKAPQAKTVRAGSTPNLFSPSHLTKMKGGTAAVAFMPATSRFVRAGSASSLVSTPSKPKAGPYNLMASSTKTGGNVVQQTATSTKPVGFGSSSNNLGTGAKLPGASSKVTATGSSSNFVTGVSSSVKLPPPPPLQSKHKAKPASKQPHVPETLKNIASRPVQTASVPTATVTTLRSASSNSKASAALAPEPVIPESRPRNKEKASKKGQEAYNMTLLLHKIDEIFTGPDYVSLKNTNQDTYERNTKEMVALQQITLEKDDNRENALMNSPLLADALKNPRKAGKGKGRRVIATPGGHRRHSLRMAALKGYSDASSRGMTTRGRMKVTALTIPPAVKKRGRSPETDTDSPVRLNQKLAPTFNFLNATKKQPKKKVKEEHTEFENRRALVAPKPVPVLASSAPVPDAPAPILAKNAFAVVPSTSTPLTGVAPLDVTFVVESGLPRIHSSTWEPQPEPTKADGPVPQPKIVPLPADAAKTGNDSDSDVEFVGVKVSVKTTISNSTTVGRSNPSALLHSVVQDFSVLIIDDEGAAGAGARNRTHPTDAELMPPPTPKFSMSSVSVQEKENQETYDITMLGDYDEEGLEHRADKAIPQWTADTEMEYLLYRYSSKFTDDWTDSRIFPRGTQYVRFYPSGPPPRVRPQAQQPPNAPPVNKYKN